MQKHSKWLNSIIKYTVAVIIIIVPLYPKFPFIRIPGTFVSIRLEDLVIAFAGLLLGVAILPKLGRFWKNKLNQSIILFLFIGFVSLVSSVFVTKTVVAHIAFLHWIRRIEYIIPLFLGLVAIKRKPSDINFYFKLILVVVFICFLYGLGQRYSSWPIIITQNEEYSKGVALRWIPGSHINSTFAGHYDLSSFLVLVLPMIISALFLLKGIKTRLILLCVTFSGLWLLVSSASRISLASYMMSVTLALALIKKYRKIPLVLFVSIAFIGFSSNLLTRYSRLIEVTLMKVRQINNLNYEHILEPKKVMASTENNILLPRQRLSPTPTPVPKFEDRSTNIRFNVEWPRALRAFSKNPFLGTGYSSITLATDNDYLRVLGELGILGFLGFILVFARVGQRLFSAFPFTKRFQGVKLAFLVGVVGSIPGILVNAVFIDVFEASKFATIFWLLIGLGLGLVNHEKNIKK